MAKIPKPQPTGECISVFGVTYCEHKVYLTDDQVKTVQNMHKRDLEKLKEKAAKAKGKNKKKATP